MAVSLDLDAASVNNGRTFTGTGSMDLPAQHQRYEGDCPSGMSSGSLATEGGSMVWIPPSNMTGSSGATFRSGPNRR